MVEQGMRQDAHPVDELRPQIPSHEEMNAGITPGWCLDWRYLALLLVLVLPLRLWLIYNTEVAARDSIGFIRYALQFEHKSWSDVLHGNHQHPGYPLAVWAVSRPVRAWAGTDALTMRISAQLASTLAALALLVPMFYLGKELFDRQVGFWGALLFQYFPVSGHHLADGISEALFLFLIAMALWRGVLAVRNYRAREFAWCGFWGGLAYLTRPEGALVVLAVGLVLIAMQMAASRRKPWQSFVACGLGLGVTAAAVGSIYFLTLGHFTNKNAARNIGNLISIDKQKAEPTSSGVVGGPLVASVFGVFIKPADSFSARLGRGLGALGAEFSQGFHYVGWVPALLALFWQWRRLRRDAGFWIPAAYCLLHGVILLLLAMVEFYVSDRHVMVLILCGTFFAVAGIRESAFRFWAWRERRGGELISLANATARPWLDPARLTAILLLAMVLFCVPKTSQRLHGNRAGNHLAGLWLAPKLIVGDVVDDDHAYTHYYAGQVFEEGKEPVLHRGYQPTCYVVLTRSKDSDIDGDRKEKEDEIRRRAKLVYQWPEDRSLEEARVVIYAQPREMRIHPWTVAP